MTPRKILIITNRIPYPLNDGGNMAMSAMINGYHEAGWSVMLLAMNTSRHYVPLTELNGVFDHLYSFQSVDINNDVRFTKILSNLIFSSEPEHAERFYHTSFNDKLIEALTSFRPDVVQFESVYLATYLPAVHEYSCAITVLRIHNIEYQIWMGLASREKNVIRKWYLDSLTVRVRNFEREAWKAFDLLLPITEKDANLIVRLEDTKALIVAPFGIDREKIVSSENEKWVGYHIGAMDWLANSQVIKWFLKKAWPRIHKALPEFEFFFAGRNMPDEFTKMHLAGVHCIPDVADANAFIADKKILIVPLWSSGGIRVKILEAMAAGKVVITTRQGIKGITAMPGEHYLAADNTDQFVQTVKWCIGNKTEAARIGQKAQQLIREKYVQSDIMKNIVNELTMMLRDMDN